MSRIQTALLKLLLCQCFVLFILKGDSIFGGALKIPGTLPQYSRILRPRNALATGKVCMN